MLNEKENVYIVRCGEVALKGQNKPYFERMLVQKIKKILKSTEKAIGETKNQAEIDALIKKASAQFAELKTDAEYTAEEEAAAAAAAAAAKKSSKKKSSGSKGCVGTGSDVFN